MPAVCLYFQVHQPFRLKDYNFFKIGVDHAYDFEEQNREIMNRVADKCYLPANALLLKLIEKHKGEFKVAFSISGMALEQFEKYRPEVIESFARLVETGRVEILGETYYHSLSCLYSKKEFERQVKKHAAKVKKLFKVTPTVFRNTELIYSNELAYSIEKMGYAGILCEGADRYMNGRKQGVFKVPGTENILCLPRHYELSDDIAFRFSDRTWKEYPFTASKFAKKVKESGFEVVNLFMDYETIGEHQWVETGIFDFLAQLPGELLKQKDIEFKTPSGVIETARPKASADVPGFSSWADEQRDLSAWLENKMQKEAAQRVYNLEERVMKSKDESLIHTWAKLQTSDHFYYMSTKFWNDGSVHKYFSPYASPFDAYINYMNVLSDMEGLFVKKNLSVAV